MSPLARARAHLGASVDGASLQAFRIGLGLLWTFAAVRFVAYGWVEELYLAPSYHFAWVPWAVVPPATVLYGLFAAMAMAGLGLAHGRWPRAWAALFLVCFGYVELLDATLYLNHYVLLTLVTMGVLAIDWHRPMPRWALWGLRFLFATVYLWAGLCKLNPDWLLRGEPLGTWLGARGSWPVVGPLLAHPWTALAMSWGGAAYDLSVPFLLLVRRTRPLGVGLVAFFHVVVWWLFPIGIFPWLMILGVTLFFEPDWPRRFLPAPWLGPRAGSERPMAPGPSAAFVAVLTVLALFPARFLLYDGPVAWTEQGYRFAWRVLLNEKTGQVDFRVEEKDGPGRWRVRPSDELALFQHQQMRTQPDLIVQYARHLQRRFAEQGHDVAVYVDSYASLNGRPSQRMVRPDVDLTGPLPDGWLVPLEGPG